MAKKPLPQSLLATPKDDLHLNLDFDQQDSDDDDEDDGDFDFSNFSDSEEDLDSDVTLEELTGHSSKNFPGGLGSEKFSKTSGAPATNGTDSMALVPAEDEDDPYQVASDDEKGFLEGIKDEITDMVREEMHSELAVYQNKMKSIEAGRVPSSTAQTPTQDKEKDKYPDLADMEPELREGYIKMRKLDRILEKKLKKEKEVKRDRILLERRIREQLSNLGSNGRVQRDIKANTEKYLSLALPASHNEGVVVDEPSTPVTPVFQTQVDENDLQQRQTRSPSVSNKGEDERSTACSSRTDGTSTSTMNGSTASGKFRRRKKKKDFIKRNKELAANANDMIAMTDDEKKRLQELLSDVDALPEIAEEEASVSGEDNPYQVALHPGKGFQPSDTELRTLSAIDQRLQSIMPEDDFRSIASSVLSHTTPQRLFTRVGARSEVDFEPLGEKALMETKEDREFKEKLKNIEDQLAAFHTVNTEQTSETPALTDQQLESLLDDCVRCMSCTSLPADTPDSVDSARSRESARAQLMLHPPVLTEEQLQMLLAEAQFPLSTRMLALQDDDAKSANGEQGGGGVIRAETWKAIAETTLSGDEDETPTPRATTTTDATSSGVPHNQQQHHIRIRQSSVVPHPSLSDPSVSQHSLVSSSSGNRPVFTRYSSADSDGRESRVSLPEISSTPLINMPQGNAASPTTSSSGGVLNNNTTTTNRHRGLVRSTASLDSMVHNDLSWSLGSSSSVSSTASSPDAAAMSGTPLMVEDVGQGQSTLPTPQPPPLSERRSAPRVSRRSSEVKEAGH